MFPFKNRYNEYILFYYIAKTAVISMQQITLSLIAWSKVLISVSANGLNACIKE